MDVKPRPLSCMKKLSLTCEIKLQIHRPGIEKTLPAGPREAGSSPAGRWQGPGDALGVLRCRGRAAGSSRPAVCHGRGRDLCRELAWPCSWPGDRRQALDQSEKALQGVEARRRESGGMRQRWELVPSRQQAPPGSAGEKRWRELVEYVFCQTHAASRVAAPVLGMRGCPGNRCPGPARVQRPRPLRVLQSSAAAPAHPAMPARPRALPPHRKQYSSRSEIGLQVVSMLQILHILFSKIKMSGFSF